MERAEAKSSGMPFGRYVLEERIARGGMGEVFHAKAIGAGGFEKPVVIKRILRQLAGDPELSRMFVDEARIMSRLAHPNIVQVIDFGQGEQDDYFLVMELVRGTDLGAFRRRYEQRGESVPVALTLHVARQMLRGLAHAHERAYDDERVLVHRDVSPGNVLLSQVGEVKVADFGVAHVVRPERQEAAAEQLVGKLDYMAPEQCAGEPLDARADVYSVGVVLYELLTGELPAHKPWSKPAAGHELGGGGAPVSSERPEAPAELDDLLAIAMAWDRSARFASARAMAKAIDQLQDGGVPVATSDELAEAVERVCAQERPKAKPVLRLGLGPTAEPPIRQELTRTGPEEPFTMRLSPAVAPFAATEDLGAATDPAAPAVQAPTPQERLATRSPSRRSAWLGVALALALAVTLAALWWMRSAPAVDEPAIGPSTSTSAAEGGRTAPSADPSAPLDPAAPPAMPPPAASAAGAPATTRPRPDATSQRPNDGATARPASSVPPTTACHGSLHLYASHGWSVAGGPSVVQAPGRYRWPCGSYGLQATSRVDPSETRARHVVIRDGAVSVIDLR